jgi:hypothetical protein
MTALARLLPAFALAALVGCGGKSTTKNTAAVKPPDDPWPRVAPALRESTDATTCRRVLSELNNGLAANPAAEQPAGLTPDAETALRAVVPLSDADLAELRPAGYSNFDPNYLADAYYFRDIARALEAPPGDPVKQADAAFAWLGRQVVLQQHFVPVGQNQVQLLPPAPPSAVLRRGSGSGLERAFAFLAILQQLGLDACLVGPADAAVQPGAWTPKGGRVGKGPFWAVGLRAGADVILYDPWAGEKLPATLAAVTADPGVLKAWADARKWDVAPETLKASVPFLAVPLSALAPRMALLDRKLDPNPERPSGEPRLAVDPVALRDRFAKDAKLPGTKFWNPPADPFAFPRGLLNFTPIDDGGKDAAPPGQRVSDAYKRSLIPAALIAGGQDLDRLPEALQRVHQFVLDRYATTFLVPPTPREQLQRGMFSDATPDLVRKRDDFAAAAERIRTDRNREQLVRDWFAKANAAYAELSVARLNEKTNPGGVAQAQQAVNEFWKTENTGAQALADQALAASGSAEATYLLALCKHEQAERSQVRSDRAKAAAESDPRAAAAVESARDKARNDWTDARDWWGRYEPHAAAQNAAFPGRADHAKKLAARATKAAAELGAR